jgi:putative chitinase
MDYAIEALLRILLELPIKPDFRKPYEGLYPHLVTLEERREAAIENLIIELEKEKQPKVKQHITPQQLVSMGVSESRATVYSASFNKYADRYGITSPLRKGHFISQALHESGYFRWSEEIWGPTASQRSYEGRRELGNTVPGDGYRYRGRGIFQITGRYNYRVFGRAIGVNLEANPSLLSTPDYSMQVSMEFWKDRNLNKYADADDLRTVTKRINGGSNGMADRQFKLNKAKRAFGI